MLFRCLVPLAILAVTQTGCTSMSSTMMTRDESNSYWTRKDGLKGVPITLKVPTQVKLTIFERHFLAVGDDGRRHRLKLPYVIRDFSQEFIYTEKIFTVDFKRPAAGQYNLNLDLTPDQYVQQLQLDVTDTTIADTTALITALVPSPLRSGASPAGTPGEDVDAMLDTIESVVAVGLFEIDAPDFEAQMASFINCHLNQANDAWVVPPDVKAVHRVGLSGFEQQSDICSGCVVPYLKEDHASTAAAVNSTPASTNRVFEHGLLDPSSRPHGIVPWERDVQDRTN